MVISGISTADFCPENCFITADHCGRIKPFLEEKQRLFLIVKNTADGDINETWESDNTLLFSSNNMHSFSKWKNKYLCLL